MSMTPEEMRVAIAEKRGFVAPFTTHSEWEETGGADGSEGFYDVLRDATGRRVPNYPEDLNAMHEAEKVLTSPQQVETYGRWIAKIVLGFDGSPTDLCLNWWAAVRYSRATAAQRAEAFCRIFWPERFQTP